jgi:hypothetical protein
MPLLPLLSGERCSDRRIIMMIFGLNLFRNKLEGIGRIYFTTEVQFAPVTIRTKSTHHMAMNQRYKVSNPITKHPK